MAVKPDTVKDTPLGTVTEKGQKDKAPPEQKGYHGSQDDVKSPAEIEREQAAELERKRLGQQDADETGGALDKDVE